MKGRGGLCARVVLGVGVKADIVAIQDNEPPVPVGEIVVTFFKPHAPGHQRLLVIGHREVVIAQYMIMRCLKPIVDGGNYIEALKVAVDEITQVHHKGEVELVVMIHAGGELLG